MIRFVARRMVRWGWVAFILHSVILILIAPAAFRNYSEGLLTPAQAFNAQRILDGPVHGFVYDIANYRIPHGVYWWLADHFSSLDEVSLIVQTSLYLVVGGVLYFVLGALLGFLVSIRGMWRGRPDGHRSDTAAVPHTS